MFCNEPIKNVYIGQLETFIPEEERYAIIGRSFLDCYHDIAYHVEPGPYLVLETNNHAIFLDSAGVHILKAPAEPRSADEWLEPCVIKDSEGLNWVDFTQTLFEGEFLLNVWQEGKVYFVKFTDFTLKIIPYEPDQMSAGLHPKGHSSYHNMLGYDRHVKRKCPDCGGEGEVLMDFVSDFLVRCKNCKRSTWAEMCLIDAIEAWNDGDLNCDSSKIIVE